MTEEKIKNYKPAEAPAMKYDGDLPIATGKSRMEAVWHNRIVKWSRLVNRIQTPVRTAELQQDYLRMPKPKQDSIKDVGGFVGGKLRDGSRKQVICRQLLTLDADSADRDFLSSVDVSLSCAWALYSTHKHTPKAPRYRLLIPLDREVSPDEYEAIGRKIAEDIGIDAFDDTTYQPQRLMYWPSVSADAEYVCRVDSADSQWLSADEVLARYDDWSDASFWPVSSRTTDAIRKTAKKQGDPLLKDGVIGDFCRSYSIDEAINTFLPDVYVECGVEGRYTYTLGSTAAGLVVYDGKYAYSNHATDPASGKLCNAFDLVRLHKFGDLDADANPDTPTARLPSYHEMMKFASEDPKVKVESLTSAASDFSTADERKGRDAQKAAVIPHLATELFRGQLRVSSTLENLITILMEDKALEGIRYNMLADAIEITSPVPWKGRGRFWRDADDAQLESLLSRDYKTEFPHLKVMSALIKVADDRAYHPILDYLTSLPEWDGLPRVDTLLADYLGADDDDYVHAVTRKTLVAAIRRVKRPGCKFDTVLVLDGPQGIGKSSWARTIGMEWFTDSLSLNDTRDKTAAEKLQGNWIVEIPEMSGIHTAGQKQLKSFLTTQDDKYRSAYGRRVTSHPRQCIFIGTTNEEGGFLIDETGGRRYWPVSVPGVRGFGPAQWGITRDDVDQIWAEALKYESEGESLILDASLEAEALRKQKEMIEEDPRQGMVEQYLDTLLPEDWYMKTTDERRDWFGYEAHDGTMRRDRVCYQEVWCECFGNPMRDMTARDRKDIKLILEKLPGWKRSLSKQQIKGYSSSIVVYERERPEIWEK